MIEILGGEEIESCDPGCGAGLLRQTMSGGNGSAGAAR